MMAIASLALGISSLVFLFIPPVTIVLASVSMVLGALHLLRSEDNRGKAGGGIGLSSLALGALFVNPWFAGGPPKVPIEKTSLTQWKNKPASDFTLADAQGNTHSLTQYAGKAVVLNFWATW